MAEEKNGWNPIKLADKPFSSIIKEFIMILQKEFPKTPLEKLEIKISEFDVSVRKKGCKKEIYFY